MTKQQSRRRATAVALVCALAFAAAAGAQYFGRNKVQWERFDFQVLATPHFDVHYYPEATTAAEDAARMAERWYDRLSGALDYQLSERKPVILYADHADFQQTDITGGLIGEGTGGFTEPLKGRVVMPLTGVYADTDHVLGHELVHAFQFDLAARLAEASRGGSRGRTLGQLPLWMVEGLAEYLSQGRVDPVTAMWMRDSVIQDRLPDLDEMSRDPRFSPYHYGQALWAYVAGRWGDRAALVVFGASLRIGIEEAFQQTLGASFEDLAADWHNELRRQYLPVIDARRRPAELGEPLFGADSGGGRLNLAPSLSPDGRSVAFLSTRDLFSLDLYVGDVESGKVRRLFSAQSDPHFDALRFLDSAGAWSPDGRRLAFVAFARGTNQLALVDVASGDVERRIDLPGVGSLASPAWSPDGRQIAVSGTAGGISDLWLVDVASGDARRLTSDRHADLQPAFSPDGRTLAFASDRGPGADFSELRYGRIGIYLYDLASGDVRPAAPGGAGKQINPQFSADGGTLWFVADPDGVPDVFRVDLATGSTARFTRVATGVAGITDLSPALSVAGDTVLFTVLDDGDFAIYRRSAGDAEPEPAAAVATGGAAAEAPTAAVLPPSSPRAEDAIAGDLVSGGFTPSPAPQVEGEVRDYDPDLSLDLIGPVSVGVFGGERSGYGAGGTASAYFSDLLGNHQVAVAFQGGATSDDISDLLGFQAQYLNRVHRLQWGIGGAHLPFRSARTSVSQELVELDDGTVVVADVVSQLREKVTLDEISGLTHYPLSQTRRFEANVGWQRLDYELELEQVLVVGNTILDQAVHELAAPEPLDLYRTGVAYVGDNSSFGFVSPVRGGRMRIGVDSVTGSLDYFTGLVDLRRYVFRKPWTLAMRGLHYGRYGDDAESERLSPLFVGSEHLVRGYAIDSFRLEECTSAPGSSECPEFDRLVGSRMAVMNLELRVPLLGFEDYGLVRFPALATELLAFVDGGVAWTEDESPELTYAEDSTDRVPVFSAGVAARTVLLGVLPLELYYAWPLQRPEENGVFGLLIATGW